MVLHLQQAPVYRIYLFSRGWFYLKLMQGSLDYIEVKHGQHMSVHLALQVAQPYFPFLAMNVNCVAAATEDSHRQLL